jgi:hypothetical protein
MEHANFWNSLTDEQRSYFMELGININSTDEELSKVEIDFANIDRGCSPIWVFLFI